MIRIILNLAFLLFTCKLFAADVDTLMIHSQAMNKKIPNIVISPKQYQENGKGFPVLYLLHGAGGNYKTWLNMVPQLKDYADRNQLLIICPDGGRQSWYFDSPVDRSYRYESYVSNELVSEIDRMYNTIPNKKGRAIAGLSMGGHGAFYLAFKHQDIWGAAGSMSGGVDLCPFPNNWKISERLGKYAEYPDNWEQNSVVNMLYLLDGKSLKLIFDCGVKDFFFDANKRLHEKMLSRNIPHDYIERPGEHNWIYWRNAVKYQLQFFVDFFNNELPQKKRKK